MIKMHLLIKVKLDIQYTVMEGCVSIILNHFFSEKDI